jgi:hypothetical protein
MTPTPIEVTCWPDEASRTANSACAWVAEATVDGRTYIARSRHGAAEELARQLVAAGIVDRPLVIRNRVRVGTITYRSFRSAAKWTFTEGDHPLRRAGTGSTRKASSSCLGPGRNAIHRPLMCPWKGKNPTPPPSPLLYPPRKCVSPRLATGRNASQRGRPMSGKSRSLTHAKCIPQRRLAAKDCNGEFRPARSWSRFCSAACRLRAHRRLAAEREVAARDLFISPGEDPIG